MSRFELFKQNITSMSKLIAAPGAEVRFLLTNGKLSPFRGYILSVGNDWVDINWPYKDGSCDTVSYSMEDYNNLIRIVGSSFEETDE